jgi:hypothetical protein
MPLHVIARSEATKSKMRPGVQSPDLHLVMRLLLRQLVDRNDSIL